MKSSTAKVLHAIGGRTLLHHAVAAAEALEPDQLVVVVGQDRERVTAHLAEVAPKTTTAIQPQQLGTGHAVQCALAELPGVDGTVVVTYGDVPLLTSTALQGLVDEHAERANGVTILTAHLADPTGYGRVLRADDGSVTGVVEQRDATAEQRSVKEVNSGVYAFEAAVLRDRLGRLDARNAQGELYLTDVVGLAASAGHRVGAIAVEDTWAVEGVNDRVQLAAVGRELNQRIVERWMREGVTVVDPATTWVDTDVTLGKDVVLEPNTLLRGTTTVADRARIGPNCLVVDTAVGEGADVSNATTYSAVIGPEATVGPYTYLRAGTVLGRAAKAGGFVEMKQARVGDGAKAPHLSYVGDATIGEGANIGAGTIFANYDGVAKHHSRVGAHSFVGSNSVLVAPADIGDGAYVAAGSAVTAAVGPGELAVARGKQRVIAGWVARRRAGTRSAQAAEAARRRREEGRDA